MTTTIPAENLTDFHRIANFRGGKAGQVEAVVVDHASGVVTAHVSVPDCIGTQPITFRVGESVAIA